MGVLHSGQNGAPGVRRESTSPRRSHANSKRRGPRCRAGVLMVSSLLLTTGVVLPAAATTSKVAPSAAAVTALVKSSVKVTKLSKAAVAALSGAPSDATFYPSGRGEFCSTVYECTVGPTNASKIVVLFGDSHAAMWVPAILPAVVKSGAKVVVLWRGLCPAANVSVDAPTFGDPATCNKFRVDMISLINQIHPEAVLLGERSGDIKGPNGIYTSNSGWAAALSTTIKAISSPGRSIAVIEDTPQFPVAVPTCLALHPSSAQRCAVTFDSPSSPGLQAGQQAAAKATGSTFIVTRPWFCASRCPAVLGDMIPFIDGSHISTTYATYLSGVMGQALKPMLH